MAWVSERRSLAFQDLPELTKEGLVQEALSALPGVEGVAVVAGRLELVYRLPEASLSRVEVVLDAIGFPLSRRWRDRLQRALISYSEDCRLPALEAECRPPKACCNRPPK